MTSNDEPVYETVKREQYWDPERCEPLSLTTLSVGRHLASGELPMGGSHPG